MKKTIILLILLLILCSCSKTETVTEVDVEDVPTLSETVEKDYPEIKGECIIYKANEEQILNMLKHGTGVVFFSWIDCPWCHRYINNVNKICKDNGLEVMYYDIYEDRQNNTDFYKEVKALVDIALQEEDSYDADGNTRIYVPTIYFVSKGEIIGHDNSSSMESSSFEETSENYWAEIMDNGKSREDDLKERLNDYAKKTKALRDEIEKKGCDEDSACKL